MANQQNSATPWEFIEAVKKHFDVGFGFDIACTTEDAKAPDGYYFDKGIDALKQDWSTITEPVSWLNPPWKQIPKFAKKCAELVDYRRETGEKTTRILSLWNAGIGSKWFFDYVWGRAAIHVVSPRITFIDPRTGQPFVSAAGKPQTGLNDCILCDWSGEPGMYPFVWKQKKVKGNK